MAVIASQRLPRDERALGVRSPVGPDEQRPLLLDADRGIAGDDGRFVDRVDGDGDRDAGRVVVAVTDAQRDVIDVVVAGIGRAFVVGNRNKREHAVIGEVEVAAVASAHRPCVGEAGLVLRVARTERG